MEKIPVYGSGNLQHDSPTRIYGRKVASREDRIWEHITKHSLGISPYEYIAIGDSLLSEWLSADGESREKYIISNGKYLAVIHGKLPSGHMVLRSLRRSNFWEATRYPSIPQSLTYSNF